MRFSQSPLLGLSLACAAGSASAAYTLQDNFDHTNFFSEFDFFTGPDPTDGFVNYVAADTANSTGIAGYLSTTADNAVYLGVDHTTVNPSGGRPSVRVSSSKTYTHGLFIADIAHMPGSICGVWPAFWTFGPNWPSSGEIDILEGVNADTTNSITLHTSSGCSVSGSGALGSSTLAHTDCNTGNGNTGCGFATESTQGYGNGFNAVGGGVYALDWTSSAINVYFFPRNAIPADITSGSPDPSTWSAPTASFSGSGCDIDSHFMNHKIIFDTTFCGQWAGQIWDSGSCASMAPTCETYVGENPAAFEEAYWSVNSVKVYQSASARRSMSFMA
ncbi:putative endo-1,3(4)-beta-glucanase [Phlyctema vagabunda]|uniref:Endo-1,3(4)-beta-glucanase n=1 Tax=Phlyctema vagabunda TaxID=108571 RepID=A0ABR4P5P5_9HELO